MTAHLHNGEVFAQPDPKPQPMPSAFHKILVAVDRAAATSAVFDRALQLAKTDGSRLLIFHSLQGKIPGISELPLYTAGTGAYSGTYSREMIELEEQVLQEAIEELQAWLGGFVQRAIAQGVSAESDYQIGEAGRQICQLAQDWGADLIAIGRRGRSGLSELILGSVSNYVVHHAPCSVLVVQ
jgi:nucleotide-binding universal stress UspA family protein